MNLQHLLALGFDQSTRIPFSKQMHIGCSSCQALAVNGWPTHELSCPNAKHECAGCSALIPARQRWCEDCA